MSIDDMYIPSNTSVVLNKLLMPLSTGCLIMDGVISEWPEDYDKEIKKEIKGLRNDIMTARDNCLRLVPILFKYEIELMMLSLDDLDQIERALIPLAEVEGVFNELLELFYRLYPDRMNKGVK